MNCMNIRPDKNNQKSVKKELCRNKQKYVNKVKQMLPGQSQANPGGGAV